MTVFVDLYPDMSVVMISCAIFKYSKTLTINTKTTIWYSHKNAFIKLFENSVTGFCTCTFFKIIAQQLACCNAIHCKSNSLRGILLT